MPPVPLEKASTPAGIHPFECWHTRDAFGRLITFYVAPRAGAPKPLPLALFIQGSGCHSVFRLDRNGRVRGGYQNLLLRAVSGRARVIVVEKPGVNFLDEPGCGGTAEPCPKLFLEEHTLPRWAAALGAALRAARTLPDVEQGKLLVGGHSEGGIMAARLASEDPEISHVAILSGTGPTQLFDLVEQARAPRSTDEPPEARGARVREVYETFDRIRAEPDSITSFAWGHPYRRWSSFLGTSTLDELLRSRARVYLAHGSNDPAVPVASFELLRAELIRHRRDVTAERLEGADHGFRIAGRDAIEPMTEIMTRIVDWFVAGDLRQLSR